MEQFHDMVSLESEGRFKLNLDYFLHHSEGVEMTWDEGSPTVGRIFSDKLVEVFGPARQKGEPLTERHQDIAASLQQCLEEVAFHVLRHLHERTGSKTLCLSGGVAFNSVMNGKILLHTPFERLYIQAAAGDAGTALGACYYLYNVVLGRPRGYVMEHAYTGPFYQNGRIESAVRSSGLKYALLSGDELTRRAAQAIAEGKIVGWFQGPMEFGPRALGNRSIVVDPRRAEMKDILNARIKKREPFRPFAPSIMEEFVGEYFEQTHPAPSMLMVYQIKPEKRASIPAVTHVDGSGRLQTVSHRTNPRYYQLIRDFHGLTGVPVVLNTSFNEDEPIVCTPEDAINCFQRTRMDALFLGDYMVEH
jgi:carbamoyltransferase